MTIPEYDEECQCQVCKDDRENRRRRMQAWNDRESEKKVPISLTHCPICGAQVMRHFWCIDEDCGWDSMKDVRCGNKI